MHWVAPLLGSVSRRSQYLGPCVKCPFSFGGVPVLSGAPEFGNFHMEATNANFRTTLDLPQNSPKPILKQPFGSSPRVGVANGVA